MTAAVSDEVRERVGELGRRYVHLVYGAAVRQMGEGCGADDVTQAVFLVAMQKARNGGLPEEGRMAGWLLKVTGFAARRARRAEQGRTRIEERAVQEEATGAATAAETDVDIQELRAALDGALLRLGVVDREVVVRRYLRGEDVKEVAAAVGMSENTAGRRIARALEKLRKLLQRRGVSAPVAGLVAVMIAESAKAAPTGVAASAAGVIGGAGGASAAAVSIAKGATVMMKVAMMKVAATVFVLAGVILGGGVIIAQTTRVVGPQARASPPTTAATPFMETIKGIRHAYDSIPPSAFSLTTTQTAKRGAESYESFSEIRYFRDGDRVDMTSDRFDKRDGVLHHEYASRGIWSDNTWLHRQAWVGAVRSPQPDSGKLTASISNDASQRLRLLATREIGPYLAGYIQMQHVADIMTTASALSQKGDEEVNSRPCLQFEGEGAIGKFQFWIDKQTFYLVKAKVSQTTGNLYWGDKLPAEVGSDATVSGEIQIDNIVIKRVAGQLIPISGQCTETSTYRVSPANRCEERTERSDVRFNPDFAALGAFQMDQIPEGYRLLLTSMEDHDDHHYFWRGGKVVVEDVKGTGSSQPASGPTQGK